MTHSSRLGIGNGNGTDSLHEASTMQQVLYVCLCILVSISIPSVLYIYCKCIICDWLTIMYVPCL